VVQPRHQQDQSQGQARQHLGAPFVAAQPLAKGPQAGQGEHQEGTLFHQQGRAEGQGCGQGLAPPASLGGGPLPAAQEPEGQHRTGGHRQIKGEVHPQLAKSWGQGHQGSRQKPESPAQELAAPAGHRQQQ
jgi:hypothetical protein